VDFLNKNVLYCKYSGNTFLTLHQRIHHMKKFLTQAAAIATLSLVIGQCTVAATEGVVNATVTMQNISVSVASGSVSYGTLAANATTSTSPNKQQQNAINVGNVAEDFNIKGSDATGTTQTWTLAATAGSAQFIHGFCKASSTTCNSAPTNYTPLTYNYSNLATYVLAGAGSSTELYINTPTVTTDYTQHTTQVTVQAVVH
jgi:hypothetical protein